MTDPHVCALCDEYPCTCPQAGNSSAGDYFAILWQNYNEGYKLRREFQFASPRKWRFDFANPDLRIAVDIEGLTYRGKGGRHQRAAGYQRDLEKYNTATLLGWLVLRYTPNDLQSRPAIVLAQIYQAFRSREKLDKDQQNRTIAKLQAIIADYQATFGMGKP